MTETVQNGQRNYKSLEFIFDQPSYYKFEHKYHFAKLLDIEQTQGKFGPVLRIEFEVVRPDDKFQKIKIFANPTLSSVSGKKTKLFQIVCALLRRQIIPSQKISAQDIIGKWCKVLIDHRSTAFPVITEFQPVDDNFNPGPLEIFR